MTYVRGKYQRAACGMLEWLHVHGIKGGPVAQPSKRDPVIVVYGVDSKDIDKLPRTLDGFDVEVRADQPDYGRGQLHDRIPVS